jgi:hypothetical protein
MTLDDATGGYWLEVAQHQPLAKTTEYQLASLIAAIGKTCTLSEITDNIVANYIARRRGSVEHALAARLGWGERQAEAAVGGGALGKLGAEGPVVETPVKPATQHEAVSYAMQRCE